MVNLIVRDNVGRYMKFYFCHVQIRDSHFTNNNSTSLIMSDQSEFVFGNSQFLNNTNIYGGIRLHKSEANVINSTFTGNRGEKAGGMYLEESEANVTNSTFTGNQGHALVVMSQCQATTAGCKFLHNVVKGKGAVVHVSDRSEYHDQGSSFADNIAGEGGKILNKKNNISLKLFKMGNCCSIFTIIEKNINE